MKSIVATFSFALSLFATVGCGMGSSSNAGSCTTTDYRCIELGAGHSPTEYPAGCVSPSTYSLTPCTAASRVGHCVETTVVSGSSSTLTTNYYRPTTVAEARTRCATTAAFLAPSGSAVFTADAPEESTDVATDALDDAHLDTADALGDSGVDAPLSDAGTDVTAPDVMSLDVTSDVPASVDAGADVSSGG